MSATRSGFSKFRWERDLRDAEVPAVKPPVKKAHVQVVGFILSTYANRDGTGARPGAALLAARTGLSESVVRRALHVLQMAGLIVRTFEGSSAGRRGLADEYRLLESTGSPVGRTSDPAGRPVGRTSDPAGTPVESGKNTGKKRPGTPVRRTTHQRRTTREVPPDKAAAPLSLIQTATDCTDDEAAEVYDRIINNGKRVRSPAAYIKKIIKDGDLPAYVESVRYDRSCRSGVEGWAGPPPADYRPPAEQDYPEWG